MQPISRVVWRAWKIRRYKIICGLWEPHGFRDTIIPNRLEQMNWRYFFLLRNDLFKDIINAIKLIVIRNFIAFAIR